MTSSPSIPTLITQFFSNLGDENENIYNEISLQLELGIFLRSKLPNRKIQFERNVSTFGFNKGEFVKKEIDISIVDSDRLETAIELKFPTNGQVPEQMFKFCEDICFMEQLLRTHCKSAYVLILAEDPMFYSASPRMQTDGIYAFFRKGKELTGIIRKPTGKKDQEITISGKYSTAWRPTAGSDSNKRKYVLIEAMQA
jgi:hypothetical protein